MTHASTWINLEDIISDSGQEQKDKCSLSPLMSFWSHQVTVESAVVGAGQEGRKKPTCSKKWLWGGVMLCKQMVVVAHSGVNALNATELNTE